MIVCGGRDYADRGRVAEALYEIAQVRSRDDAVIVHGDARGADTLAATIGTAWGLRHEAHPANWAKHGKAAGPIRNQEMIDAGADIVLAFPGGAGTADCVRRARAAGIPVRVVEGVPDAG